MFRVGVAVLSMLGFVAGQWAAMPHAHGHATAAEQRRHDATPHFHLGASVHHHDQGHTHTAEHDRKHDRKHNGDRREAASATAEASHADFMGWSKSSAKSVEHDVTAILLIAAASKKLVHGDSAPSSHSLSPSLTVNFLVLLAAPSLEDGVARGWRDPEPVVDDSDCYLILRTLRI